MNKIFTEKAERINGWAAMIGIIAAQPLIRSALSFIVFLLYFTLE